MRYDQGMFFQEGFGRLEGLFSGIERCVLLVFLFCERQDGRGGRGYWSKRRVNVVD